ncbi:hypothetical protein [Melghirimyces profundicolus]|nr:hypothetical protein [Melghirimyces profundicolus]
MEKWVQLLVATVSLLRLLMELPELIFKWKSRSRKKERGKKRNFL